MRLHLLGLPHTITTDAFSHCAFTGKVKKFAPMMRPLGYEVIHYGVEGADSGADQQVDILRRDEQVELLGHDHSDATKFHGDDAHVGNRLYTTYNARLASVLASAVERGDIVCHPFGHAHSGIAHRGLNVETGIGYPQTHFPLRIFESMAWMHWHLGRASRHGSGYEWVIPNYFLADEWPVVNTPQDYVLYFGRLCDIKGLPTVVEMAKRLPNQEFVLCGQGDPTPYLTAPNIRYEPPRHGRDRAALLGQAKLVVMPTQYVEPFGGVAVEAMLCGTPVAGSPFGAFTETVTHGVTGWRCRTLSDWVQAIALASTLDRSQIGAMARARYSVEAVGPLYDHAFQMIHGLVTGRDWYTFPASF